MFEKIFEEIFGDVDFNNFAKAVEEEIENEKEEPKSYFHKVVDEYEDGKHVSHKEKEVKDGKVIKNVNENYKLEDKNEKNIEITYDDEKESNTIAELKSQISEMETLIHKLKEENHQLCKEIEVHKAVREQQDKTLSRIKAMI